MEICDAIDGGLLLARTALLQCGDGEQDVIRRQADTRDYVQTRPKVLPVVRGGTSIKRLSQYVRCKYFFKKTFCLSYTEVRIYCLPNEFGDCEILER